jgi:hypothetical protein
MRARTAVAAAALGVVTSLAVATGCGVESNDTGPDRTTASTFTTTTTNTATVRTTQTVTVPRRPDGTVAIDVLTGDPITAKAVRAFGRTSSDTIVQTSGTAADNFAALCSGQVDVVTSNREPTSAELAVCKKYGLTLAAPMQTASEAIVLATKNGSDVGGDCITVRQARDIYKAGSTYDNWNQLGFDDLPLRTVGRDQDAASFQLFGQIVLGIPEPTIGDLRADYLPRSSDLGERETVTGAAVYRAALRDIAAHTKKVKQENQKARTDYINAAIKRANDRALKVIDAVNERNRKRKIVVDVDALVKRNAEFVARVKRTAGAQAARRWDRRVNAELDAYAKRKLRNTGQRGFVGPFTFSYYGLFEDQLRPLEIDYGVPETKSSQPVRFEDLSDADQVALARQIGEATGQTTPNPEAVVETTTTTEATRTNANTVATTTRTTAAKPQPVYQIEPSTVVPPLDNLPKTTRTGEAIYPGPNCVFPSALTITNGAYPLARRIFLYTTEQALERDAVQALLNYYIDNAQTIATNNNLIPVTNIQIEDAKAIIEGRPQPKATIINGTEATVTTPTTTTNSRSGNTTTVTGAGTRTSSTTTPGAAGTATTTTTRTTGTATTTTPTLATPNAGDNSGVPGVSDRDVSRGGE